MSFVESYETRAVRSLSGQDAGFSSASFGSSSGSYAAQAVSVGYSAGSSSSASGASASSNNAVSSIAQDLIALSRQGGSSSGSFQSSSSSASGSASGASFSASASGSASAAFLSEVEQAILRSQVPIEISETEEITALGNRGIWANRQEVINWRGVIPITEYILNEDANPEVITKRSQQTLTYIQELAIRYLRPPTPPAPGEIVITQEVNTLTPPAPPLVIRQQPARASTPEPLVIREAPPQPPAAVGRKVITISGKRLPPPPRKVVIERLAPLPSKPQSVLVERWLPYGQVKRRVIFQRAAEQSAVAVKPRNVIVQWEAPQVEIKKEFKYLGVIRANPVEYVQRYGASLKVARELPQFVLDIKTPEGIVLAADYQYNSLHELEGDVQALRLVDLDREGLSEYRAYLAKLGISFQAGATASGVFASSSSASVSAASASVSAAATAVQVKASVSALVEQIFNEVDRERNGRITVEDAEKAVLRLNSRLRRQYGEDDIKAFFAELDTNRNGSLDLQEFQRAFLTIAGLN